MQSASVRSILPEQHPVGIQGIVCPRRRPHIRGRAPVPSELDVPQLLLPLRELLEHRARRYAPPRAREHGPVEGPGAHDGDGLVLADLAAGAGLDLGSGGGAGREEVVAALIDPGERDGARGRVGLVEAEHAGEVEDVPAAAGERGARDAGASGDGVLEAGEDSGMDVFPPAGAGVAAEDARRRAAAVEGGVERHCSSVSFATGLGRLGASLGILLSLFLHR